MTDETVETPDESSVPEDQVTEETTSQEDATAEEPKKTKKTAHERIDELTGKFRQAERDAEFWRMQAMQKAQQPAQAPQPEELAPQPPQLSQFADDPYSPQYQEAHAQYTAELAAYRTRQEIRRVQDQTRKETEATTISQTFHEKASKAGEDGAKALQLQRDAQMGFVQLSDDVGQILTQAENGIRLASYLNDNRSELYRLNTLPPAMRALELGRLDAQFASQTASNQAIQPIPTVDGPTSQTSGAMPKGGFKSQAEYRAWRAARKAKR
jgi:hypothetical protein